MLPTDVVHSPIEGTITIWHCAAHVYEKAWTPHTILHYPLIFALLGPADLHPSIVKCQSLAQLLQQSPLIPQRIANSYPYFWRVATKSLYIATSTGIVTRTIDPTHQLPAFHFNTKTSSEYDIIIKRTKKGNNYARSRLKAAEKICGWFAHSDLSTIYLQLELP